MPAPHDAELLEEARPLYSQIYDWHIKYGREQFDQRIGRAEAPWRTRYLALRADLVEPGGATATDMLNIARVVLGGSMEWSHNDLSNQGLPLSSLSKRIEELLVEYEKRLAHQKTLEHIQIALERLRSFRSLGDDRQVADGERVSVPLSPDEPWNAQRYLAYAADAYRDVAEDDTLGGRVFLNQTNMDHAKKEQGAYVFHNARLLHVELAAGEGTLAHAIDSGDVIVEAVVLGR